MTNAMELEINLSQRDGENYAVELRVSVPDSEADIRIPPAIARFDFDSLRRVLPASQEYGAALTDSVFSDPKIRTGFSQALASAQAQNLPSRIRLLIAENALRLHGLAWETLNDPSTNGPLCANENILFSRFLSSIEWRPMRLHPKGRLNALLVVANPENLSEYQDLAPIDIAGELRLARQNLGNIPVKVLPAATNGSTQRASLNNIVNSLSEESVDILYLVCHAAFSDSSPYLWLEDEDGKSAVTSGDELAGRLRELQQLPRLIILASSQSTGTTTTAEPLMAVAPRLAQAGVPGVLAMQGKISLETASEFLPTFFTELQSDGVLDRAAAVARNRVRQRPDYWMPVLFMRVRSGRLWYVPGFSYERDERNKDFQDWRALTRSLQEEKITPILGPLFLAQLIGEPSGIATLWAEKYNYSRSIRGGVSLPQVAQFMANNESARTPAQELERYILDLHNKRTGLTGAQEKAEQPTTDEQLVNLAAIEWVDSRDNPYRLLANLDLSIYITTNPDQLLFEELRKVGKNPRSALFPWNDALLRNVRQDRENLEHEPSRAQPLVYYLFGRFSDPSSLLLTEDAYYDFTAAWVKNKEYIPASIRYSMVGKALLLLGFDPDDASYKAISRSVLVSEGSEKRGQYKSAIQIAPYDDTDFISPDQKLRELQNRFRKGQFSIYWGSPVEFLRDINDRLLAEKKEESEVDQVAIAAGSSRRAAQQEMQANQPEKPLHPAVTQVTVYSNQTAALHSRPNVLSPTTHSLPANSPLQVVDTDPGAALKRLGDPDQWLEVQAQVDGEQVQGFIEADLVSSEPVDVKEQTPPPTPLPQAWIVVANPRQYSWDANFSKITSDGPPVEVNWTHARGALAQYYIKRTRPGDIVLAYLSSAKKRAIIGLAEVAGEPQERDGWWSVRLSLRQRFNKDISLAELKRRLPELEKVRVERASFSLVASDLWPGLRSLILAGNSDLESRLPQALAAFGQQGLALELEPQDFPAELPANTPFKGSLRVTNTGTWKFLGGKDAPWVSITAEWYPKDAALDDEALTSHTQSYNLTQPLFPGESTRWNISLESLPAQPGEYEVRLVVADPAHDLAVVSTPIQTKVLDPQTLVSLNTLRTRIQDLRRELRESDEMGVPAVAAIDATLIQAEDALSNKDKPTAQKHIEDAEARWKTWQQERTARQEIEDGLQKLAAEASRSLPQELSEPFGKQVSALHQRNNGLAPLKDLEAGLDNLRVLNQALQDKLNQVEAALAPYAPAGQLTRFFAIDKLTYLAGQPYQSDLFNAAAAEIDQQILNLRKAPSAYSLKVQSLNLPESAQVGEKLPIILRLLNTGPVDWDGGVPIFITEHIGRRTAPILSGLTTPVAGIESGSDFDIQIETSLPDKPGKLGLSWLVELPAHKLKKETPRYMIQVTEQPVVEPEPETPVTPPEEPVPAEEPETAPHPPEPGEQPQPTGVTIGGINLYNAPVEINYNQLGDYAGPEPAQQKITITITSQTIELTYNGVDYLSPSSRLLNNLELKDPFRFKPAIYGNKLFNCLISTDGVSKANPPTRDGFTLARSQSEGGRLEIAIESRLSPDQGIFYWEYLTDDNDEPLATFASSPFYRQVGSDPGRDYPDANPLKILFAISSPQELSGAVGQGTLGLPAIPAVGSLLPENPIRSTVRQLTPLDRKAEADAIHDGMKKAADSSLATYEILGGPDDNTGVTWERIQGKVITENFHVLHLLAHGIQNPLTGQFNLVMETPDRRFLLLGSDAIDAKIADNTALRLVTLASCRSADPTIQLTRESRQGAQSFAEYWIEIGIPAVIAMQDNMDIAAAQLLTRTFYDELARFGRIDTALAAARRDLYTLQQENRAWGIPVLLLKGGNPFLFHVDPSRRKDKKVRRDTPQEKIRDLKSYEERTGRKDPVEERLQQEVEKIYNASGAGAAPVIVFAPQQPPPGQPQVKSDSAIPLAEPQATRILARRYYRRLSISTSALQDYVANVHKDRLRLPDSTYAHIASSLNAGKHIILTGPPGSAKTSLAMAICDFVLKRLGETAPGYVMTTATSDWTTFDTVGGYMPDQRNNLQFRLGVFLDAIRKGEWLVIDEINRAEIDKAFGPLFTVLSGQEVVLPYRVGGETVCVQPAVTDRIETWGQNNPEVWIPAGVTDTDFTYVIHPNWRIIGTMNVYDKSSLFQMSLAFMRRFAFIDVELPDDPTYTTLIERWWNEFVTGPNPAAVAASPPEDIRPLLQYILWQNTYPTMPAPINTNPLMKRRAIGPAIVRDMLRYVGDRYSDFEPKDKAPMQAFLAEAFALYVTPQLDGLDFNGVRNIHWHFEQRLFAKLLNGAAEEKLACALILNKVKMLYPHIQSWDKPEQEDK